MWEYLKLRNGYVRIVNSYSDERFMFDTLRVNRSLWNILMGDTVCLLFKHKQSFLCIEKGYTETLGSFEIRLCDRCCSGIIFYEGIKNDT